MRISMPLTALASLVVLIGTAAPASAQHGETVLTTAAAVPSLEAAAVAVRTPLTTGPLVVPQQRQGMRRSTTLMIIGGAIFLAGAIIGDDAGAIIMIGGAATALYGLYIYLDREALDPARTLPAAASSP